LDAGQTLTAIVSGVAFATSIAGLLISYFTFRRDRSHVKVTCDFARLSPKFDKSYIVLTAINDGRYAETVTSVGFLLSDGKTKLVWGRPDLTPEGELPWTIAPNESRSAFMLDAGLRDKVRENKPIEFGFAGTKSGRTYRDKINPRVREFLQGI